MLVQLDDSVERAGLMAAGRASPSARMRSTGRGSFSTATSPPPPICRRRRTSSIRPQGALAQIEATLAQKAIKAPFDGTIGIPKVDPGQFMPAGTAIATLQDLSKMRVDFTVPEQELPQISSSARR